MPKDARPLPQKPTAAGTLVSVRPTTLLEALEGLAPRVRVLSLDCFDTLLWRRTATPVDVFYDLQHAAPFAALGYHPQLRATTEATARGLKKLVHGDGEVTLPAIYRAGFPELGDADVAALEEAELSAEIDACYAHPSTVALIRAARARGLRIVIVSDTYLRESQLRRLLAATVPADVYAAIEQVFCSCEHGKSKSDGLFKVVVPRLGVPPQEIAHVGDNLRADGHAAAALGLHALHLRQHDERFEEISRLGGTAASLFDPDVRARRPLYSPFRGVVATAEEAQDPAYYLGYGGAGPILYPFARFLLDELEGLVSQGKRVKPVFLMRDAFLPLEICNALSGREVGREVALSRFASFAASFRGPSDVDRYLARFAGSGRFDDLSRQLLLSPGTAATVAKLARRSANPAVAYAREVKAPDVLREIVRRSSAYRQRLYRYLEAKVGLERGDTLVLVDLGYEGTTQRQLARIFEDELGVEVVGRYLIVSRTPGWQEARRGLIDPSNTDDRAIAGMLRYIALLEMICTKPDRSVVDYSDGGEPIYAEHVVAQAQFERMRPVQEHAIGFAKHAEAFFTAVGKKPKPEELRMAALGALGRLLFLPSESDLRHLSTVEFDMNLATTDTFDLFDCDKGLEGLRRRGMFFMEQNLETLRTNYPAELRHAGLELSLALMSQHRYSLDFNQTDLTLREERVSVVLAKGGQTSVVELAARATHDGYFALIVPVGACEYDLAIVFGARYAMVQVDGAQLIPTSALFSSREHTATEDLSAMSALDGMVQLEPGVFSCPSRDGALVLRPRTTSQDRDARYACRVVFRPLAARDASQPVSARQ